MAKFLSNRFYITELAEASPESFLNFIEKLPEEMLSEIFKPRKSIICPNIYYLEILYAIEMLAWNKEYLSRATELLLRFFEYENRSNWVNRPSNSLYGIYRLIWPQTHVSFEKRLAVLKSKSSKHKSEIYTLCKSICESLRGEIIPRQHHYYRWQTLPTVSDTPNIKFRELNKIVELMLECCDYSVKQINDLITLSFNVLMSPYRSLIINSLEPHLSQLDDKQKVIDILNDNIRHSTLQKTDLKLYQCLLKKIQPKDLLHKHAWLFESFYVEIPTKTLRDYKKCHQDLLEARTYAIREIIESCGKNAIWDFINIVKCPESISESLVFLYGEDFLHEICQKYKHGEINEDFFRLYLYELCRKDINKYQVLAQHLFESDKDLAILLFAPGYIKELAELAAKFGDSTEHNYWEHVKVIPFTLKNADEIVYKLINANRCSDAIQVIYYNRKNLSMTDLEISQLIYDYVIKDPKQNIERDLHYIAELLETLDKSEDRRVIDLLITIEFCLYDKMIDNKNMSKSRLIKELTHNPDLMMEVIKFAYKPDDSEDREFKLENPACSEIAGNILCFGCSLVPRDNNGNIDELHLYPYIKELRSLAKEKKRTKATDRVIGFILGDIPLDDKYPPEYLCEIVKNLDNDIVDQSIQIRILQSRGITSRLCNEGGDQERELVSKFTKYKEQTELLYSRMAKIFSEIIEYYKNEAERMDENAEIYDLEY